MQVSGFPRPAVLIFDPFPARIAHKSLLLSHSVARATSFTFLFARLGRLASNAAQRNKSEDVLGRSPLSRPEQPVGDPPVHSSHGGGGRGRSRRRPRAKAGTSRSWSPSPSGTDQCSFCIVHCGWSRIFLDFLSSAALGAILLHSRNAFRLENACILRSTCVPDRCLAAARRHRFPLVIVGDWKLSQDDEKAKSKMCLTTGTRVFRNFLGFGTAQIATTLDVCRVSIKSHDGL